MSKVAKAPAKKTSPVMVVGGLAAVVVVYLLLTPASSSAPAPTATKPKPKNAKDASGFMPADYAALKNPFPTAAVAAVDAFNPVVKKTVLPPKLATLPPEPGTATQIPATLTGGEANWYFTGCPSTDGVRTALFENTSTGESVFVKAGQAFKAGTVQSVDISTVVLTGPNGVVANVPIVGFGETPGGGTKSLVAGNGPLPIPTGPIGGALPSAVGRPLGGPQTATLANGQTVQLPANLAAGAGNDLNVAPDTNTNNTGRRRRRNRNQNLGDPNNGQ